MMKRPRLNRPFCLTLLAISVLLALTYFPLTNIRAANSGAKILPSTGKPLVNLKSPQTLKPTYTGSTDAVAALQSGTAIPRALASADFDADGAMDVVAGYSTKNGGVIALFRGNQDAFAPKDTTLYQKAMKGSVPPTFLSNASAFSVPESPDLMVTGDFNRDGFKDVLVGARGGSLYLLAGDGHGNLLAPQAVPLPGQVMAMDATADGHVAVSTDGPNGPQLAILAPSVEGLIAGATYPLPARGDAMAWGNLGGGADFAVGAGSNVVMFYNALTTNPQTETVAVPFEIKGLTLGDFIWDRDARTEISVLADDGSIHILQHGTLNTAPLTAKDVPARRAAMRAKNKQPSNPTSLGAWTVARQLTYFGSAPSGPVSPSAFSSPRVAAASTHDLMVIDAGRSQLNILDTSGKTASPSAGISFASAPVAALAMPQRIDASRDLVVLTSSQSAPTLITAPADPTFNVTTTADEDDAGSCTASSGVLSGTGGDGVLSLREAVCEANNNGNATSVINVPAGTYSLAISTFGGKNSASSSGALQVGIQSGNNITISGAGAGSTIIQQTNGHDRVIEGDELLNGNQPLTIQNVTLQNGNCTEPSGLDCADNGGGAILAGGPGDNLTITNVTMTHNGANPTATTSNQENGGALTYVGPTLVVSGSTFSSNTASGGGGAAFLEDGFFNGGFLAGSISITNSVFTSNTAEITGGGLDFDLNTGYPATVSGSTFRGNRVTGASGTGGAISEEQQGTVGTTVTVSGSVIVGNIAGGGGTGASVEAETTGTLINNWWGCNGGPGTTGCDTVISGTFNPWLVLSIGASPNQILTGATSTLSVDMNHNSNGQSTGLLAEAVPVPVSFGGTLGTSIGNSALVNGLASGVYTAGATAGHGTATATVDNGTATTPVEILDSVTVATSPTGLSITVDGVTSIAPQSFNWVVGSSHTIATTSPQTGPPGSQYVFNNWSDSGAISHSVTAPTTATTYTATFDQQFQLTTQASPSADGTVTPASGGFFAAGATIPVTATANSGFQFNNWTSSDGTFDSPTAASTNFHMPGSAATVTGNFIPATVQITITTSPANLLVSVDGGTFAPAPLVETWNIGSSHTIATTSPQTGGPGAQFAFNNWSDSGAISHSIAVPSTPTTYTASFNTQYQLTTAANPIAGGSVSPASGAFFNSGTIVPLTATANAGFAFVNWTGNVASSSSASTTITMTAPQSVTANFTPIIVASPTTTSVSSNNNPSFTTAPGNSVTFTATVTSNSTVNEGTVTFSDPANDFTCSGGNTVPVSNGQASCTTSFTTEGGRVITAAYSGTVNFQGSSGMISQFVNNHTVITGNQFCNQGPITIPSTAGAATPYPSNIFVTGLGNVGGVTVSLNNISSSNIAQTDLLLVGPTGAQIVPFASVGDGSSISGVNVTLDDAAAGLIPGGSPLTTGSYKPTSITGSTSLIFPAPAPAVAASNYAPTDGTATLTSTFQNTAANGTWALYAMDNSGSGAATIGGGWCVNISPATVQITVTTSPANLLVSVDGGTATAAPLVENWVPGSSHTIATTSPQAGGPGVQYVFNSWSDTGAISHSISVPSSATTYTASFTPQYQLTTQASPSADGTVTPASGSFFASGATIPVTATANSGFTFNNWSSTGGTFDSTTAASTNFHMPAAPATVTGNFTTGTVQITVTTSPVNLLVSVDGGTFTAAPLIENWVIGSPHTIATTSPQAGGAGVQFVFNNWSDTGAISHGITVPSTPTTYTASFNTQYQLTTAANPSNGGTVSPASGNFFNASTVVPLTATANAGFTFSNWTGNVANANSASTSITMNSPQSVTANFSAAAQLTVTPTNINFGNVYLLNIKLQNVTVKNVGSSNVSISKVSLTQGAGDDFNFVSFCPSSLAPGKSCAITVFFFADDIGTDTATLNIADNAAGSPQQVSLSATVINPQATFRPSSLGFGTVKIGHSSTQNTTLTNTGTTNLNITSIGLTGANTGDFTENSSACPSTLTPGASCMISVTFSPTTTGSRTANLTAVDNAQISRQNVFLSGKGSH